MGYRNPIRADLAPTFDPHDRLTGEQAEFVDGLRDLAEFLTEHPDFIAVARPALALRYATGDAKFREIADTVGADEPQADDTYRRRVRRFGPHEVFVCTAARAVELPVDASEFDEPRAA